MGDKRGRPRSATAAGTTEPPKRRKVSDASRTSRPVWHIAADWVEVFSPTVFGPLDTQLRTEAPDDDPMVRPQQPVIQLPLVRAMAKSNTSALRRVGRCREHTRLFVRSVTPRPHGADRSRQRSITSQLVVTG